MATCGLVAVAWPGMDMPVLHVDGRYLKDDAGNVVNLHGFAQTYSPWFNERGTKWNNYDVNGCLEYNKKKIDELLEAGWKMNFVRIHMDPYWSNTPGVSTTGENDISAFDFNRFRTYLSQVFIPMAEYAVSKGLYVVMRPPGVCPEKIEIGDAYHKYLKRVWGYVSTQSRLTDNPHIMFELANEPVQIMDNDGQFGSNTDGCFKNLTAYFQEIVDLMRGNGCDNILWIPGTGYQSQYAGFARYPVTGDNIGYAVHVYPGWYGSDAIEPSHELGGSYGGGFNAFAAGWASQIKPVADFAPVMVTEMDWAPSKYDASWGKSITGKMFGEGFGANFKLLADNTGNVSWLIFSGCELLAAFKDEPGERNTVLNDSEACLWPVYHWYKDYAGEKDPSEDFCLEFSVRKVGDEYVVMPGNSIFMALISDSGNGYQMNRHAEFDVTVKDPDVVEWSDGVFTAHAPGLTDVEIGYTVAGNDESVSVKFNSTFFPFINGYLNPSIWEEGTFDENTCTIKTGKYGFAGWKYSAGIDLSSYRYLIAEMEGGNQAAVSFRVFDQDNYWTDPAVADFGNRTKAVLDLANLKSDSGRLLDPSHIFIVGFWSLGNTPFRVKKVYLSDNPDGESALDEITFSPSERSVDVYNIQGMRLKTQVSTSVALNGLPEGLYIVDGKKIVVKR
ncbi:glycosyl hydrolase family 5 [Duncaniella dubosii]|uniref:Glycosyl hydrolase family 5 n=6 Tax=Muribaculaceae TaxID=2005473 RepID=A0A4P7W6J5_9BACT|nr:glycosyl hydrolase family 5 [Duncaniella dubosii]